MGIAKVCCSIWVHNVNIVHDLHWNSRYFISWCEYYYMGFLDTVGLRYNPGISYVNIFNDGKFNSFIFSI